MKIGIIGSEGIVGSAVKFGMERLGHEVWSFDLKLPRSSLKNVLDTSIVFICLPTPSLPDGSCDTRIVENTVLSLKENNYFGIVVIKSTIIPGTTQRLQEKVAFELVHSPEFLKERSALLDFAERQDLLVIGTNNARVFEMVKNAHGNLPKKVVQLKPIEAEFLKYMNNCWGSMLVTFANSFYELCNEYNVNYTKVKEALVQRDKIPDNYLTCNEKWRGYISPCWDKDLPAINCLAKKIGIDFFENIIQQNDRFVKTVAPNTRTSYTPGTN